MKFTEFAQVLQQIENTSGRNAMIELLAGFLPKLDAAEIKQAMYLMQGRLVPQYEPLEFLFSGKMTIRALQEIAGDYDVAKLLSEMGDIGEVAAEVAGKGKGEGIVKGLEIAEVYESLMQIATTAGKGSQEAKIKYFTALIQKSDALSVKYITRIVNGNLRLGVSDKSVLDALSFIKAGDKSLRGMIERAYGAHSDIGELTALVLTTPLEHLTDTLQKIKLQPGVPVASKLVEREKSTADVFERMGACIVQPKLDGLRGQIHLIGQKTEDRKQKTAGTGQNTNRRVEIFSRNMERMTDSFPDLVEAVLKLPVDSAIIDSETIGYDFENEAYLPFQQTTQRRRKYDVDETAEAIRVRSMCFDLLYLNGEDISQQKLEDRIQKLEELLTPPGLPLTQGEVPQAEGVYDILKMLETVQVNTADEMESFFKDQVTKGLEGIIIKKLGTTYDPGTRNFDWIKLKASSNANFVDTIDAVVIGYYYGQGSRAKFGMGALLLGVYDPESGNYYSVAKVGTGITDAQWETIRTDLEPLKLSAPRSDVIVDKLLWPDVWVKPQIVIEVEADQITRSPGHSAARDRLLPGELNAEGRGLSLRFPRLKVWNRDKGPESSTSVAELLRIYELRRGSVTADVEGE